MSSAYPSVALTAAKKVERTAVVSVVLSAARSASSLEATMVCLLELLRVSQKVRHLEQPRAHERALRSVLSLALRSAQPRAP